MKKMKNIVPLESPPRADYEDQRTRHRHQSLLQDHEELQKEMEVMRRKLQIMNQRRLMLSSEVRFFRRRYRYLMKNASLKPQPKQDFSQQQNLKTKAPIISKGKNYSRRESNLHPHVASHSSAKQRNSNRVEAKLQKSAHTFDLNQNARSSSGKDTSFHSGKETTKKSITPFFDLNQISTEEELLGDMEPMKIEEPKRNTQRGTSNEQHGDIKLSVCRNVGSKSNKTGKRKISRQDQVALRV